MRLSFVKTSPSGNTTLLVSTPVPREKHGAAARALMAPECACAEQVCFREPSRAGRERMQMMGGEFCVNAAMSMAACFLMEDGGAEGEYPLEASGCETVLAVKARRTAPGVYACQAPLPGGARVEDDRVYLPGIAHRILSGPPGPGCEDRLRSWAQAEGGEAYGYIFVQPDIVRPLVYVPASDTMVWENACGSGAAALAALTAWRKKGDACLTVPMPGGSLSAQARWENAAVRCVQVENTVRITLSGTAWIDL